MQNRTMLAFIRQLKQHHLNRLQDNNGNGPPPESLRQTLSTLRLAEACLLKLELLEQDPDHPRQIVVLGPTQAGKSTLVNFLTNSSLAGVSALAGYTVHAHAYTSEVSADDRLWADSLFEEFKLTEPGKLDPENYQQYTIQSSGNQTLAALSPCVLWDTPDFDSVKAYGYNTAVLRTLALADVVVLIVSREKYADKSVWDLLQLIQPLQKPLLVCINKLDTASEQALPDSFRERYAALDKNQKTPTVIGLPFIRQLDDNASELPVAIRKKLIRSLEHDIRHADREFRQQPVFEFMEKHWRPWTGPITEVHLARKNWLAMIESSLEGAKLQYKRDYLDHPDNYDAFKRTLAQLLILLELPGVAQSLVKARQVVTWPVRKLISFGKGYAGKLPIAQQGAPTDMEQAVLRNICSNTLTTLVSLTEQKAQEDSTSEQWWNDLGQKLIEQRDQITRSYDASLAEYQSGFEQDIDKAAHELYRNLEQQPATLNSLRAARVTADAAAVGLALKTGGIGMNDFLLAPAMLSVTTLLTESALGKYIDRVKAKLRVEQFEAVDSALFKGNLKPMLTDLAADETENAQFNITEKALVEAEHLLRNQRAE